MRPDHRSAALILAAALLVFPRLASARDPYTERSELTLPATGLRVLELDNPRGSIQVRRSTDGKIHLVAYKICRGETEAKAKDLALRTEVLTSRAGGRYKLQVKYPQNVRVQIDFWKMLKAESWDNGVIPRVEVRLVAETPEGIELDLRAVSGDISTEGLNASQRIQVASGDVVVKDAKAVSIESVSGDVSVSGSTRTSVHSASGDLDVVSPKGPVDAQTVSGTIVITQASDSLRIGSASGDVIVEDAPKGIRVESVSGEVRVKGATGVVDLSSASGDIRVRVRGPLKRGSIDSTSGEVWLDLAGGMDASLDVGSVSGTIDCRVPLTSPNTGRHGLTGTYGRGGSPIQLRSASGDITVTSGGR